MSEEQTYLQELLETSSSRRRALELILGAAAGAVGSTCLFARSASATVRAIGTLPPASGAQKVLVGKLADLPPGSSLRTDYRGQPVLVFNIGGDISAFSAICTHEGCIVDWNRDRQIILCPCHGGEYGADGKVVAGPPPAALLEFKVVIEDGKIYLDGFADEK